MADLEQLEIALGRWLSQLDSGVEFRIRGLAPVGDGWETEVYACSAQFDGAARGELNNSQLILRVFPGAESGAKAQREFAAMLALHQHGFPVPRPLGMEPDSAILGAPFLVMDYVEGKTLGDLLRATPEEDRPAMWRRFCQVLAELHALDVDDLALPEIAPDSVDTRVALRALIEQAEAQPIVARHDELAAILAWLKEGTWTLSPGQMALIHWDYHPQNVLVEPDGRQVVIDWSNVMAADTRLDLAWSMVLIATHGSADMARRVLEEYEGASARRTEDLAYFEAAMAYRRLFSVVASLADGAESQGMRPGAERYMREARVPFQGAYRILADRTGRAWPQLERFVAEL